MASNSFKVKNSLVLTPKDLSTLTSPEAGDLACDINDSNKIKRYDAASASWVEVGSGGGVGGVDIFFVQDFESASLSSFTQTGLVLSQTNPLKGKVSAGLTHQAGTSPTNDQFFTQVIPVDRKFRGQLMNFALNVRSTASPGNLVLKIRDVTNSSDIIVSEQIQTSSNPFTANTSSGSPTLSNISNADIALLQVGEAVSGSGIPTGAVITALGTNQVTISANASATATGVSLRASSLPARRTFSFKIPESCASLSYTITALPEANSPRSIIDDIICELSESALLETSVVVPNVTAWQGYTPTFQGFGSPTNIEFEWRQVGENVEVRGKFTSGTPTAVEARIGLPAGLTSAGTSLIPSLQQVGITSSSSTTVGIAYPILIEPSVSYVTMGVNTGGLSGLSKANGNGVAGSGTTLSFFASIPCAGLSATSTKTIPLTQSGLVQEADGNLQINTFTPARGSTNTAIITISSGLVVKNVGNHITWSSSSTLGDTFTATKTGIYTFNFSADFGTNTNDIGFSKNSTQLTTAFNSINASDKLNGSFEGGPNFVPSISWTGHLVAGDVVRIHTTNIAFASASASYSTFSCTYQGSLKVAAVNADQKITIPTSELRFEGASTRGSTATAIVRFDNVAKLRGDAFTVESDGVLGTRITMKKAGRVSIASTFLSSVAVTASLTKNQALLNTSATQSEVLASDYVPASGYYIHLAWTGDVSIGDTIRVNSGSSPTANIYNNLNLSFQEQDIQVSVSNTLPQFSESDSSVRVDGSNGYGTNVNNKVQRFSNVRTNLGSDIIYLPSDTEGDSFLVNSDGIYNISFSNNFVNASDLGIVLNATDLITGISTQPRSGVLNQTTTGASNWNATAQWSGFLNKGSVIRAFNDGAAIAVAADTFFTISKVGKPNVTGVNVTPFVNVPRQDTEYLYYRGIASSFLDGTSEVRFPIGGVNNTNKGIIRVDDDSVNTRTKFTALKNCIVNVSWNTKLTTSGNEAYIYKNGSLYTSGSMPSTNGYASFVSATLSLAAGEFVSVGSSNNLNTGDQNTFCMSAVAESDQILTAPETFSTDTAALTYAGSGTYTLSTLQNAPVGTYITFTYAANTNTRTQTTTPPNQSPADMNVNGILLYTRAYNAPSSAAQPAVVAIQIGKGLKGKSLDLYKSAGKVTSGSFDSYENGVQAVGARLVNYSEITGVLYIDAGYRGSSVTSSIFEFNDLTTQASGYLVINASKNPALTGVPLVQPRIATLSDVKANGTAGGTATSGSYQTRTLNTLNDPTGIVTSLASNQFTLPAGEYYIEASAPAYAIGGHKIKIRNITDSTDAIIGTSEVTSSANQVQTNSSIRGTLVITSAKTFELQHRVAVTRATEGYGVAVSFGDNEVYSILKIQKIK